jgi:hypothetical protein
MLVFTQTRVGTVAAERGLADLWQVSARRTQETGEARQGNQGSAG